jgi:hypothetical protein
LSATLAMSYESRYNPPSFLNIHGASLLMRFVEKYGRYFKVAGEEGETKFLLYKRFAAGPTRTPFIGIPQAATLSRVW